MPDKKWAMKFDACKICEGVDYPHRQQGFCTKCWGKERYKREKPKYQEYNRQYWEKNKDKLKEKNKRYYKKVSKDKK